MDEANGLDDQPLSAGKKHSAASRASQRSGISTIHSISGEDGISITDGDSVVTYAVEIQREKSHQDSVLAVVCYFDFFFLRTYSHGLTKSNF